MKKLPIVLLGGVLSLLFLTPAFAGWWGGAEGGRGGNGPGNCGGPCYTGDLDNQADKGREEFLEQSRELRQQLYDRKNAYSDLMQQENPDKEQASLLWNELFDLQTQLRKMAADAGFKAGRGRWRNEGNSPADCGGPGCGKGPGGGYGPRGGSERGCNGPGGRG